MKKHHKPTEEDIKKFRKLYREVIKITKPLDKVEVHAYTAHFYQYLLFHQNDMRDGKYDKWREFFNMIVLSDLKQLGDYGHYLISSTIRRAKDEDFEIIENRIALKKLLDYISYLVSLKKK